MANVLYRASISEWVSVVADLQERLEWDPVYWIGVDRVEDEVRDAFPSVTFQQIHEANRAGYPSGPGDPDYPPVDADVVDTYAPYRAHALRMMDRMDLGQAFSYDERVRHYHKQLRYWRYTLLSEHEIDKAVFVGWPHVVGDYVPYIVAAENDVDVIISNSRSHLPGVCYLQETVHHPCRELADLYSDADAVDPEEISESTREYLEMVASDDPEATYSADTASDAFLDLSTIAKAADVRRWPEYYKRLLGEKRWHNVKVRDEPIERSEITEARFKYYKQRDKRHKRRLKRDYDGRATTPAFDEDYVYVPLHFEPETSTVPLGNEFRNQFLAVDMLAATLPEGWKLYVKEHPVQLSRFKVQRGRETYDYDDILDVPGTQLVERSTSAYDLMDNAKATATVTGTGGWESVVRGTPSIVFGNPWYRLCDGVYEVGSVPELREAISEIASGASPERDDVFRFARALERVGYRGYNLDRERELASISPDQAIRNAADAIVAFDDRL